MSKEKETPEEGPHLSRARGGLFLKVSSTTAPHVPAGDELFRPAADQILSPPLLQPRALSLPRQQDFSHDLQDPGIIVKELC